MALDLSIDADSGLDSGFYCMASGGIACSCQKVEYYIGTSIKRKITHTKILELVPSSLSFFSPLINDNVIAGPGKRTIYTVEE